MEVRSLTGIKRLLWLGQGDHAPITALQSSSVRSNLHVKVSVSMGDASCKIVRYIKSRELDTIRKRISECVGCLDDVSSTESP